MRIVNSADAFDLIAHAPVMEEKLSAALQEFETSVSQRELQWLQDAVQLIKEASAPHNSLIKQCLYLPELTPAREEEARLEQNQWVDILEKLQAGIMFHAGSRAPILETLYPRQKLPSLRKASAETVRGYHDEFHRRLKGSYVQRMLQSDDFAFAMPILDTEALIHQRWQSLIDGTPAPETEAAHMRESLVAAAQALWRPMQQARMLGEAALLPIEGAFERLGLGSKPRKRALRILEDSTSDIEQGTPPPFLSAG